MKIQSLLACAFLITAGCTSSAPKLSSSQQAAMSIAAAAKAQTPAPIPNIQTSSDWKPTSNGAPYQLALKNNTFSFCDNTGSQQVDLATGHQTAGTSTCDRKNDALKTGCGDQVDIVSSSDGPYDTVSVERYSFRLHGHARDCDRDGSLVIVSTTSEIVLINASTNKIAFIKAVAPDTVVIGSGWAAWNSLDKKLPLRLGKTANLLQQATTPREN